MIKRIRLDFDQQLLNHDNFDVMNSVSSNSSSIVDYEISKLLTEDWIIHSVIPISGALFRSNQSSSITTGLEFILVKNQSNTIVGNKFKNSNNNRGKKRGRNERTVILPDEILTLEAKIQFYNYWVPRWSWDGNNAINQLDASGKKIRTFMIKRNILSNNEGDDNYFVPLMSARRNYVDRKTQIVLEKIRNNENYQDELFDAFNAIQAWGGSEGRQFYNQNGYNSLNVEMIREYWMRDYFNSYKEFVVQILSNNNDVRSIIALIENFDGLNVAFGSKHLYFWSLIARNNQMRDTIFPIYDRIIHKIVTLTNSFAQWRHYLPYLNAIEARAIELGNNYNVVDIERALFSYAQIVGVQPNNQVPNEHNQEFNLNVNGFINSRLA
jgi:hypothetical protein